MSRPALHHPHQVNTTTINPDRQGRLVNFLGLENLLLPAVYAGLLAASAVLLVVWLVDLSLTKKEVSAMHLACAAALAVSRSRLRLPSPPRVSVVARLSPPLDASSRGVCSDQGDGGGRAAELLHQAQPAGPHRAQVQHRQ